MSRAPAASRCLPLLLLGAFALLCAAPATAQPTRKNFWAEVGAGTGGLWVGCAGCETPPPAYGESSYLRAGGTFSDRVLWGFEVFTLLNRTFESDDTRGTLRVESVSLAPVVLWYPWQSHVFFKGGVGLSRSEVRLLAEQELPEGEEDPMPLLARGTGVGMTFGAGFDVPVLSWLALTVNAGAYFGAIGDLAVEDAYIEDVITTMYNANFALTLR